MSLVSFSDNFPQISYIKIINYSDSISANLTMQTKQHAMKKPHFYSNRNKIYKGLFVVEGQKNVQNLLFLLIQYLYPPQTKFGG